MEQRDMTWLNTRFAFFLYNAACSCKNHENNCKYRRKCILIPSMFCELCCMILNWHINNFKLISCLPQSDTILSRTGGDHVNVELWFWMLVKQDRFEYHHFLNWRAGKTGSNWIYFSSNWKFGKCPVIVCLWRPFQRRRGSLVRCKKSPAKSKKSLTKSKPKRVADCLWMLWHVSILPTLPFSHFHFLCRGHGIII